MCLLLLFIRRLCAGCTRRRHHRILCTAESSQTSEDIRIGNAVLLQISDGHFRLLLLCDWIFVDTGLEHVTDTAATEIIHGIELIFKSDSVPTHCSIYCVYNPAFTSSFVLDHCISSVFDFLYFIPLLQWCYCQLWWILMMYHASLTCAEVHLQTAALKNTLHSCLTPGFNDAKSSWHNIVMFATSVLLTVLSDLCGPV